LEVTGRPAKSTASIIEKLRRESVRLTQMQDIAGCRVVVDDIAQQDRIVTSLCSTLPSAAVVDRRRKPSYGYRAVHVIARDDDAAVEIQVRTKLQHLWAELSEKLSDVSDPSVKYGGGEAIVRKILDGSSNLVVKMEDAETQLAELMKHDLAQFEGLQDILELGKDQIDKKNDLSEFLLNSIKELEGLKR